MIKVEDFSHADELELFISIHNIKREDIIDIKWAAAKNGNNAYTYGLLIYETNEETMPNYHSKNI